MTDMKTSSGAAPRLPVEDDYAPPEYAPPAYAHTVYGPRSGNPPGPQAHPFAGTHQQLHGAAPGRPPHSSGGGLNNVNRQFPPEFNGYSASALGGRYNLGESQAAPLYVVTIHTGWSGNPDVVLHTTTDKDSPPLATANFKTFSHDTTIVLPPLDARSGSNETVMTKSGFFQWAFSFIVEVPAPDGKGMRSEGFEWRHSKGQDVAQLDSMWGTGWKLVRMGGGGKEVVAVFTTAGMSLTKKFCFKFLGAGDSGVLGERWAVMAVISALAIWEKDRRAKRNNAA